MSVAALLGGSAAAIAQSTAPAEFNQVRQIENVRPAPDLRAIRVVSWNIDRGRQLEALGAELEREHPDLCLLQEVDWNANRTGSRDIGEELARKLRLNLAYAIEFEELGQEAQRRPAYIGQATLTRLPVRAVRVLRFREQSGFWAPHRWIPSSLPLMQRRKGNRIALVTELEFAKRTLVVYNAHLESRSLGRVQNLQLDEILADVQRYLPDTPIILGGDLNTKYFPGRFLRKLEQAGFQSVTGERIERTHAIAMALDWIFVKGPVAIEGGEVRRDSRGSDHYPIYAKIVARSSD